MAGLAVGIDFGTSTSAAAMPADEASSVARVLDLDPVAADARLLRSVLFFPEDSKDTLVGEAAIQGYLSDYEGRFLQSVKTFLPQPSFTVTEVRRRPWRLDQLIAVVLKRMRDAIERQAGGKIETAVFGRPAVFSLDPVRDALAEGRLRDAALLAGFPEPVFVIEPVAAALRYEESLAGDEVVLVGDFGAGTSDFTLMRLGPSHRGSLDRRGDVLASSGVYVGGDRFDAAIVEHKLLQRFGAGSTFQSMLKRLEIPGWMTRKLLAWNELSMLRERSNLEFLRTAVKSSDRPADLQNLVTLAEENLPFQLYRSVEAAKRRLGEADEAVVSFHVADIDLEERVTRRQFEQWSTPLRDELSAATERCLARAGGIEPDAVFLTGGTSKIPSVRALFAKRFGEGKLRTGDAFTSVAAGLGRAAGLVASGGAGPGRERIA